MRHGAAFTAFFDANVFYPFQLRDLVMRLASKDLFRARWSEKVSEEWIGALLKERPDLQRSRLEATRDKMNQHVRDAIVRGYEYLIPVLVLPDKNDVHVLAAAIHGRADVLVTGNLKHFPDEVLQEHNLHAQHPDEFIAHLIDLEAPAAVNAVREARAALRNPTRSAEQYLASLERAGLPQTVSLLRPFSKML